ncbi:sensor histidine kinase [Neoroseomonas lacus]|uniref:histidine kinase n=1 Tax=Neoroseomonas lacus TaxID=287609 RepID=A0A917L280_9PROT|nr:HAMP domain-containing sensor histidine kinase [Neoroseomonas lacus]GGJ41265.1 two-component sensor histidine kinase [Neoroseomonas lacus]
MTPRSVPPPSLTRRMTLAMIAFHALGILLLLLAQPLLQAGPGSLREWFATEQATKLLRDSLGRDTAGVLVFQPTSDMFTYIETTPEFWFGVADGTARLLGGRGSPPVGVRPGEGASPPSWVAMPVGVAAIDLWIEGRRVAALIGGHRGSLAAGIWAWITDWLGNWLLAVAAISAGTSLVTWLLVRFLLRPVREAAEAAGRLVPGQHQAGLPVEGVPAEILPLVSATNLAFTRVEKEHERQRRFIANAAHELRTPIAILSLRLDELPDDATRQKLQLDVRRLTLLANQLLDLERMRHAADTAEDRTVEMVGLAREVVAELVPLALTAGSDIALHSAVPRWSVRGDEQALRSVLLNLIGNALAHGGPGVQVELRIDGHGFVEVSDNGPGVREDAKEQVFEAFQRAGGSGSGAGLGLYIVRELLRAHGASIDLLNGKPGAVFRLRFPKGDVFRDHAPSTEIG